MHLLLRTFLGTAQLPNEDTVQKLQISYARQKREAYACPCSCEDGHPGGFVLACLMCKSLMCKSLHDAP